MEKNQEQHAGHSLNVAVTPIPKTFENFQPEKGAIDSFRAFKDMAEGATWHMLLCYGPPGSGKSHLMEALYRSLKSQGVKAVCKDWPEVVRFIKSLIGDSNRNSFDEMFDRYCNFEWLLLDDVGSGTSDTEWAMGMLEDLVNYRYNNYLPTVITTNLDGKKLPPRIVSRFKDAIQSKCVMNNAEDYRPKRTMKNGFFSVMVDK